MKQRRGHALRRRYGHAEKTPKTAIRVIARRFSIGDGPGPIRTQFEPGDRIEVGGPAANGAYLIAYRVQRLGEGWTRLGPFAVVSEHDLAQGRKEELQLLRGSR
jgi:hypothetical protein